MTSEGARRAPEKERNCDVGLKQLTPFAMLRNACAWNPHRITQQDACNRLEKVDGIVGSGRVVD